MKFCAFLLMLAGFSGALSTDIKSDALILLGKLLHDVAPDVRSSAHKEGVASPGNFDDHALPDVDDYRNKFYCERFGVLCNRRKNKIQANAQDKSLAEVNGLDKESFKDFLCEDRGICCLENGVRMRCPEIGDRNLIHLCEINPNLCEKILSQLSTSGAARISSATGDNRIPPVRLGINGVNDLQSDRLCKLFNICDRKQEKKDAKKQDDDSIPRLDIIDGYRIYLCKTYGLCDLLNLCESFGLCDKKMNKNLATKAKIQSSSSVAKALAEGDGFDEELFKDFLCENRGICCLENGVRTRCPEIGDSNLIYLCERFGLCDKKMNKNLATKAQIESISPVQREYLCLVHLICDIDENPLFRSERRFICQVYGICDRKMSKNLATTSQIQSSSPGATILKLLVPELNERAKSVTAKQQGVFLPGYAVNNYQRAAPFPGVCRRSFPVRSRPLDQGGALGISVPDYIMWLCNSGE